MTDSRQAAEIPKVTKLSEYKTYPYKVESLDLVFDLAPTATIVTQTSYFCRIDPSETSLTLNGKNLKLMSIQINDVEVPAERLVYLDEILMIRKVPEKFELRIETEINPEENTALEGLYLSNGMFCTQCEAEGFRRITYYPDRPDVLTIFTTTIRAEKCFPTLLSNGNEVSRRILDDDRIEVVWSDPFPKPCYLFALVAGDLACKRDNFVTQSGREIDLRVYVAESDLNRVTFALESLKRAMRWDEKVYGREYDLDIFMIVAVSHFNMGAMENKGLNIFNSSCVLANQNAATDSAFQRIEAIVAHEYFHNWSGNRVTCRDWFQLSLKEGFTVFRDAEFTADTNSRAVKRIQDVNFLRAAQFIEDAGPTSHPVQPSEYIEISNFYTLTIYEKGAEIVRMIRTLLGDQLFRQGSDLYFNRHDGEAVTIEDFVNAMSEVSGRDFQQFMNWYRQPGTPIIKINQEIKEGILSIVIEQHPPKGWSTETHKPYLVPISYKIFEKSTGRELIPESLLELTEPKTTVEYEIGQNIPVLSVLRGLSAPVKLYIDRESEELAALARFDDDGVNRWDAMQALYVRAIKNRLPGNEWNPVELIATVRGLIESETSIQDEACLAEMLTLPQSNVLWDEFQPADPQAIACARNEVMADLGKGLFTQWEVLFSKMQILEEYQPISSQIGKRSLGLCALGYLANASNQDHLLETIFHTANNLTQRVAAYRIARQEGSSDLSNALSEAFLQSALTDEVLDLWLSTEAVTEKTATLDRVRDLTEHPRFAWTNPNRVRAVIGSFANRNVRAFHTAEGYNFLKECVLRLDSMNPQIAARLVMPLTQHERFTSKYSKAMLSALRELADEDLSRDLREIIDKSIK